MTPRSKVLAAFVLIALLGALIYISVNPGSRSVPFSETDRTRSASATEVAANDSQPNTSARSDQEESSGASFAAPGPLEEVGGTAVDSNPSATGQIQRAANTLSANSTLPGRQSDSSRDQESGPPFWCLRNMAIERGAVIVSRSFITTFDGSSFGGAARIDSDVVFSGSRSVRLDVTRMDGVKFDGAARSYVLWQAIRAAPFRGKRISYDFVVRAERNRTLMSFFLRAQAGADLALQLSGAGSNPLKNPTSSLLVGADWISGVPLVLDVPVDADVIYYGATQVIGSGPVWIDHVTITSRPAERPIGKESNGSLEGAQRVTIPMDQNWVWDEPRNLDFEMTHPDEGSASQTDAPTGTCENRSLNPPPPRTP